MHTKVGDCPRCGAPIYVPSIWHGVTPPPNVYSCDCVPRTKTVTKTGTGLIDRIATLAVLLALVAAPALAADPPAAAVVVDLSTGTDVLVTRDQKREFVTARATATAPLFAGLSAVGRLDLGGEQDAGGLDVSDFSTFRRIEAMGGLSYDLGAVSLAGIAGATFSVEGESGAPQDPRMYTMAALARVGIGDGGYAYAGGGFHGPVGGWALLGAFSVPAGPAYATVDYAFPLSATVLQERAWVLRIGAQVRVKRIELKRR